MKKFMLNLSLALILACGSSWCQDTGKPVIIYADTRQEGAEVHARLVRLMEEKDPAAVFHAGDMVKDKNDEGEWESFKARIAPLMAKAPYYPAIGNHEAGSPHYFRTFGFETDKKWYSEKVNGIYFIVLDSEEYILKHSPQYNWLISELESSKHAPYVIIVFHKPVFSSSYLPQNAIDKSFRYVAVPLFEKYRVSAVFSGHVHAYERCFKDGIYYITTGGGGSPLRPQKLRSSYTELYAMKYHFCCLSFSHDGLRVDVYDDNGLAIDAFYINQRESDRAEDTYYMRQRPGAVPVG